MFAVTMKNGRGAAIALDKMARSIEDYSQVFREIKRYQEEGHRSGGAWWYHSARWQKAHSHTITMSPKEMNTFTKIKYKPRRPIRVVTVKGEKHHREAFERWAKQQREAAF